MAGLGESPASELSPVVQAEADGKKKRVVKQEIKKKAKEQSLLGGGTQAKLCFKPLTTSSLVVLADKESSLSKEASIKSQQDKQGIDNDQSMEEEKGDLPLYEEEAGEDLKMSQDPDGANDANQQSMPKKRGRKPKVILDPSSAIMATKIKAPKRVELSTTIEVPEKVSWTVTYFSRCAFQIKEWKDKMEQFDAILKSLLKRQPQESPEFRENL